MEYTRKIVRRRLQLLSEAGQSLPSRAVSKYGHVLLCPEDGSKPAAVI
jgi:hypothetical protein